MVRCDPRRDSSGSDGGGGGVKQPRLSDEDFEQRWRAWAYRDFSGGSASLPSAAVEGEPPNAEVAAAVERFEGTGSEWVRIDTRITERGTTDEDQDEDGEMAGSGGGADATQQTSQQARQARRQSRRAEIIARRKRGTAITDAMALTAGAMPVYRMYLKRDGSALAVLVRFAHGSSGHPGILHGGVSALVFDEAMGYMAAAARLRQAGDLHILVPPPSSTKSSPPSATNASSKSSSSPSLQRHSTADYERAFSKAVGFTAFLKVNYRKPCLLLIDDDDNDDENKKNKKNKRFEAGHPSEAALCVVTARDVKTDGRKMFLTAELASASSDASSPSAPTVVFADAESLYVQPRSK